MDTLPKTGPTSAPPSEPDAASDVPATNPLAQSGGSFQDDPYWDEMQASIRRHRREMDAAWDESE